MTDPKHYLLRMTHKEFGDVTYVGVGEFPGTNNHGWCLSARTGAQAFYSPKEARSVLKDPNRWAYHTEIGNYHATVVGVTVVRKEKKVGFDLIDVTYLEMLISQRNSLCMDDENDREQMALYLMTTLILPMRQRLSDLAKKPAVMEGPAPGCVHLDDVAYVLFGE